MKLEILQDKIEEEIKRINKLKEEAKMKDDKEFKSYLEGNVKGLSRSLGFIIEFKRENK